MERGYRMEAPEGCPAGPYDVMRAAWHADPAQRPTFAHTRLRLAAIRETAHAHQVRTSLIYIIAIPWYGLLPCSGIEPRNAKLVNNFYKDKDNLTRRGDFNGSVNCES